MKRITYSSLILFLFILSSNAFAQAPNFSTSSQTVCYNSAPGSVTVGIFITVATPLAASYIWVINGPSGAGCSAVTQTNAVPNGSIVVAGLSCCGTYTITKYAVNASGPYDQQIKYVLVECPSSSSLAISSQTICRGNSAILTGLGASSYSWTASASGGGTTTAVNPITVSPSVNATYTMNSSTAAGCALNPLVATVAVQVATIAVSPTSITACANSTISLTSTLAALSNTSVAAGTVTNSIIWYNPLNAQIGITRNIIATVIPGTYTAALTHTGSAGSCTSIATLQVFTTSTMPLTITASAASVCPGANVILTGNTGTVPTASSGYTWSATPATIPANFVGNPATRNPTATTIYSVNASYYGCSISGTIQVGMLSLTPTLVSSAPFSCPNRSITLSASGAVNYSFSAVTTTTTIIPNLINTNSTVSHTPTLAQLNYPIQYCVSGFAGGCSGTTCISVGLLTLTPTLTSLSGAFICPGSALTLSATGGTGSIFSFSTAPIGGPNVQIGAINTTPTRPHTIGSNPLLYPFNYTVSVDSAGCKGTSLLSVDILTINPVIVSSSSIGVCLGTQFTLTSSGGTGTSYTWTAPPTPTNPITAIGNKAIHSNTILPATYSVSVDSLGCKGSAQLTISELTISPQFTISPSSGSICPGSTVSLHASGGANTSFTFYAPYPTSPPSTVNIIPTINASVSTVATTPPNTPSLFPFSYTVSVDSGGCQGVGNLSIGMFVMAPQNLTLTTNPSSVCPNSQFILTATPANSLSAYNYTFYTPVAATSTVTNLTNAVLITAPSSASLFPRMYTILADSSNGSGGICTVAQNFQLNLLTLKNFSLIPNPPLVCAGQPVTLTAVGTNTNFSLYNYTYTAISPTANPIVSALPISVINPTTPSVYELTVDSAGCKTSNVPPIIASIGILPSLTFTPSATNNSVCAGLPSTITLTGGAPTNTYTWLQQLNTGTLTVGAIPSSSAISNPTTNATYTINAIDPSGCVGTNTIQIFIDPAAQISLSLSSSGTTLCPGSSVTLTALANINPSTFSWSPASGLNSTIGSSVISSPSLTTVYTATANNGFGCKGSSSYTVIVGNLPNLMVTPSASAVCVGFSSTLTAFGAQSYTWTGSTFTGSIPQQSISVLPGTYSLTGSNGGTCIDSSFVYTVVLAPNLNITYSQNTNTTCIVSNFNPKLSKPINLQAFGAGTYAWSPYDPATMTYSLGPQTTIRPHASTCYTLTGATSICSGSVVVCATVIPQFTMAVSPPLPAMCIGDSLKLNIVNISNLAVGPVSQFGYNWADPQPVSVYNPLSSSVIATPQSSATYSVEVTDSRGCISIPRLVTVTVFPRPLTAIAIPTINGVPTNTVCFVGPIPGPPDNVITLTGINTNVGLQFGIVPTYTWSSPYSPSSILTPGNNNVVTVSAPKRIINNSSIAVYTLQSGYNGIPGCSRFDTVSVRVIDCRPVSAVTTSLMFNTAEKNDTVCARQCITFINQTDTAAGGPQIYDWRFSGGSPSSSTLSIPTVCYNLPGKFNVILTVKNPYPIADGGSVRTGGQLNYVKVVDVPNVTITSPGQLAGDTIIRFGESIVLNASNALSYIWSPGYNISSLTNRKITVNPFKTTQYVLKGFNSGSCYSSDTLNVIVIDDCGEMYVPNAFSPNNDGHNDVLYLKGHCLQIFTFMIFNRWGEKIFETTDQKIGWDGFYKGSELNTGIYVYRVEGRNYEGKGYSAKGNITLIR